MKQLLPIVATLICVGVQMAFAVDPLTTVTEDPTGVAINRFVIHKLAPFHQEDEAMDFYEHSSLGQGQKDYIKEMMIRGADEDYFQDMDYGITRAEKQDWLQQFLSDFTPGITKQEAVRRVSRGRNNWMVWTGGNDRFWNFMTKATLGSLDFLKTISGHPSLPVTRKDRWQKLGLVNEPCFESAKGAQQDKWGLWLDLRTKECGPDPFANEKKYPGIPIGARGKQLGWKFTYEDINGKLFKKPIQRQLLEVGSVYGDPTGVVGLRLFTNPDFDEKAAEKWDPVRYYKDADYYNDPKLIRPYRVGMTCAFCHVGPNPTRPPSDFNNPKWANLNSNPGAQYFWTDRILVWDWSATGRDSFVYQLLHTSRPGSLDTSLVSSDQINNPRTMNAVYNLPARMALAAKFNHVERLKKDENRNEKFSFLNDSVVPADSPLRQLYSPKSVEEALVLSPRILKDGSDSVGALGALNRVYVNI